MFRMAVFCLWLALSSSISAKQGSIMSNTISYTSTAADDQFPTRLLITPQGLGQLSLGSNRDRRDRAVGQFQQTVPANLLQALNAALASPDFAASASQASLVPDEAYREINLSAAAGDQPIVKRFGEQIPPSAAFVRAERELVQIIEYLQSHPVLSIAMQVLPLPAAVAAGRSMEIEINLRNLGRSAFFVESPMTWGQKTTSGELKALRSDIPSAQLRSQHQVFGQLQAANFVKAEFKQDGPAFEVAPGALLSLRFKQPVDWPAGDYAVEISMSLTLFSAQGKALFIGGLVSPPQAVKVTAAPGR